MSIANVGGIAFRTLGLSLAITVASAAFLHVSQVLARASLRPKDVPESLGAGRMDMSRVDGILVAGAFLAGAFLALGSPTAPHWFVSGAMAAAALFLFDLLMRPMDVYAEWFYGEERHHAGMRIWAREFPAWKAAPAGYRRAVRTWCVIAAVGILAFSALVASGQSLAAIVVGPLVVIVLLPASASVFRAMSGHESGTDTQPT